MKLAGSICIVFSLLFLIACEKEEIAVKPYPRGGVITNQVDLKSDYSSQVWFDLETNKVVQTNLKTDWDIAFDCAANSSIIYLNASRLMQAAESNSTDFDSVTNLQNLIFRPDHPSRKLDSLGIGDFTKRKKVHVVDLGYNGAGIHLGYKKVMFEAIADSSFLFTYADLAGTKKQTTIIQKNTNYNSIAFSFEKDATLFIEPPKNQFTLCFTQYTYFFYLPYTPYLVTGILSNKNEVLIAKVNDKSFTDINTEDISKYQFSDSLDAIGYSWKEYDFGTSTYHIFSDKNFLIKDASGFYFKLHFIDFYNDKGEKGFPKFEFQKL